MGVTSISSQLYVAMKLAAFLCFLAVVVSEVHGGYGGYGYGGYGYGGLFSGPYGGFGPFLGYGGLVGGLPYFGFGGYGGKGGYGYGGKGGYSYGGSRYKRSTDSYTTAQPSPVTHYSPAVHAVHSSSHADTSPVHHAIHHASPVYHAVPASRTVHVSGHFSPAVVYSYPMHDGDRYGSTHSSYGYTTPSYGHSYGHSTPIHSTVVHKHESPYGSVTYGHNTPSYGYATPPSQGHSPSYSYTSY